MYCRPNVDFYLKFFCQTLGKLKQLVLQLFFRLSGDGKIQQEELQHVIKACMEENDLQFSEDQIDDLTMALFEDADSKQKGEITYEALKNQLEKHAGLLENLSIRWYSYIVHVFRNIFNMWLELVFNSQILFLCLQLPFCSSLTLNTTSAFIR